MNLSKISGLETKEKPKRIILEIGSEDTPFYKEYGIEVPKDVLYKSRDFDWDLLPDPELTMHY